MFPSRVMMEMQIRIFFACLCLASFLKETEGSSYPKRMCDLARCWRLDSLIWWLLIKIRCMLNSTQLFACLFFLVARNVITEKCVEIYSFGFIVTLLLLLFPLECQSHLKANFASWHNQVNLKKHLPSSSVPILGTTIFLSPSWPSFLKEVYFFFSPSYLNHMLLLLFFFF